MDVFISKATDAQLPEFLTLSKIWEEEKITRGMTAGKAEDFQCLTVWTCTFNKRLIGYLSGHEAISENMCIFPPNTHYFEIDELYVLPQYRNLGIGRRLFECAEQEIRNSGVGYLFLSSATNDYLKIQNFYTKLGMQVWTQIFFKELPDL